MPVGQASHSCCLCKSNGSVTCRRGMAETLVTLAFLSALAMILSPTFGRGKWLASLTALFCCIAFVSTSLESIQQSGGSVLVIVVSMAILLQYRIRQGISMKYLNGIGGSVIVLMLLSMYPEGGIEESITEYSLISNAQELLISIAIGLLIAQLLVNSIVSNQKTSFVMLGAIILLFAWGDLLDRDILPIIVYSCAAISFLPFLEEKINDSIGSGQGRSFSLGFSTLVGIFLIFAITYVSVSTVDRIGSGDGAIAVSLWMTLAASSIGLIGMLLPLLGFDSHPRPEAWGWRISLALSPMFLTLQTDLSPHILLGITLAILISISAPLVLEKNHAKAV